ncbi:MAG: hypothetical protein OXH32_08345 [Acidobacteria bacterium]|nr:hypothetical protein [Acidobacteriota bacterium]
MAGCRLGLMIALPFVVVAAPSEPAALATALADAQPVGRTVGETGGIVAWESSRSGVVRYQHDDGDFDADEGVAGYVEEYAMRYDLSSAGTIVWLEACFALAHRAAVQDYVFDFVVYGDETRTLWNEANQIYDKGSRPGAVLKGPTTVRALLPFYDRANPGAYACVRLLHGTDGSWRFPLGQRSNARIGPGEADASIGCLLDDRQAVCLGSRPRVAGARVLWAGQR